MRNHIFKAVISIFLALTTCILSCTGAFAASSKEKYISELILCPASSADDAEAQLKEKGYKLLSDDAVTDGVYIGYKSTADKDEAITDVSAMNMSGNYSFSDYETLLQKMRENVSDTVDGLVPMISAFRENYKAGTPIATEVYEILNKFYEDDSKQGMGDFLLKCSLEDTADLTEVFLQGYSAFILDIQQLLFIAGENDSDKTWIEKMAASDPDDVVDLYVDSYPTPNRAYSALAADYGDAAESIKLTWDAFYENLSAIKSEYFEDSEDVVPDEDAINDKMDEAEEKSETEIKTDSSEEVSEEIGNLTDSSEVCDNVIDINLVTYLDSLEYDEGTMLDFFMRSSDDVDENELYTLAYYMGKDLTDQISNVGLEQVMSRILVDSSSASADKFKNISEMLSEFETISIYDGVDRSLFENGVALTGESVKKYESSGKSWSDGLFDRIFQPSGEYKWKDYLAFYVLPTVASLLTYSALMGVNVIMQKIINKAIGIGVSAAKKAASKIAIDYIYNNPNAVSVSIGFLAYGKGLAARGSAAYRFVAGLRCAFFVLTIAMTLVSIVMLFVTLASDDDGGKVEYTSIPNHIVDTVSTDNGDDYIAYNIVKNISGSAGDLYNYNGQKGWLALYCTKDKTAGNPLTTDMKIVKGSSNAPLDYENISLFGQTDAVNVTSKDYTGVKDSANGTYMYFARSISSAAGSAFSGGNMAIAVAAGGVIGIMLGLFFQRPRKKEEKIPA